MLASMGDAREPRWDIDFREGEAAEELVRSVLNGVVGDTIEVKMDRLAGDSGNLFVEYACLRGGEYQPSGIASTKAWYWVFVVNGRLYGMSTPELRKLCTRAYREGRLTECKRGSHPTKGLLLPFVWVLP